MIDLKLKTFLEVARLKNFTRAADILCITQPAVSQHIKSLEDYYGVKLLRKSGREMQLTEEGRILYQNVLKLDRLNKIIRKELRNSFSVKKKFSIGATLTIGGYFIPARLADYRKENPNIDITLHVNNTETIIKKLYSGDIELALIEGPFDRSKVKYRKIKDDELVLIVGKDHPFAAKKEIIIDELISEKIIMREKGSGTRQVIEDFFNTKGITSDLLNITIEIGDITAIISLVESGQGCSIISREVLKHFENSKKLSPVLIKDSIISREFNLIYLDNFENELFESFFRYCLK